jgi:hypothetical protein
MTSQDVRTRVLQAVTSQPGLSGTVYSHSLRMAPYAVRATLKSLVEEGLVLKVGRSRGTKWHLNAPAARVAQEDKSTPKKPMVDLKSPEFKVRITQADSTAKERGLDRWGARIVWVVLSCGPRTAHRYASKSSKNSQAWKRWSRLTELGIISEHPEGVVWDEGVEPWESDPMLWFDTLVEVSAGKEPPVNLPRGFGDIVAG